MLGEWKRQRQDLALQQRPDLLIRRVGEAMANARCRRTLRHHSRLIQVLGGALFFASAFVCPTFAADTGLVFVSNEKSNEVVVYDAGFNRVKSIPTSRRPRDMHFNADHTLLYVACGDDDAIDVIDVKTLAVVKSIPTGPSPEMFVPTTDGKAFYVSDEEDSRVEKIDIASGRDIEDIPTGPEPEGVMLSPDGRTLYATSETADMVHVIDTASGKVIKNIVVGTRPRRFVMTPDGKELWVSCELSSEIDVIDRATNTVTDQLTFVPPGFREEDVTPVGMTITKDGSKVLLTLGRSNHIAIVDARSKQALAYVLVGSRAWGVDLSQDEKTAVVTNGLSDDITIVDMGAMKPVRSVPVGRTPHSVVIDD
jgi:PQQ-dependent catabolism-associated beta-propeller protein